MPSAILFRDSWHYNLVSLTKSFTLPLLFFGWSASSTWVFYFGVLLSFPLEEVVSGSWDPSFLPQMFLLYHRVRYCTFRDASFLQKPIWDGWPTLGLYIHLPPKQELQKHLLSIQTPGQCWQTPTLHCLGNIHSVLWLYLLQMQLICLMSRIPLLLFTDPGLFLYLRFYCTSHPHSARTWFFSPAL